MAVYVDDMSLQADVPNGGHVVRGKWSHLFADTEAELKAFARQIGLRPEWIQHEGTHEVHFDVTSGKREHAIASGAEQLTWREAGVFFASQARKAKAAAHRTRQEKVADFERGYQPDRQAEPREKTQRHSWSAGSKTPGNVKVCGRDGCGMAAEQRKHPTEQRFITIYSKDDRRIISERVPRCGDELPQGVSTEEMQHLAIAADRQAALAYKQGDLDRAFRLLTDARVLDPGKGELWDSREQRIREAARHRQAQAPERPAMDSPEVQAEARRIHEWNNGLPRGYCGPPWRCPEHGEKAVQARQAHMFTEREGAA